MYTQTANNTVNTANKKDFVARNQKRTEIFETKYKDKAHMETITKKTKMCKHWMSTQSCPRGDQCKFAHGNHEVQVGICNFTKDTCKFALAGTCKFKHVDDEDTPRVSSTPITSVTPITEEKVTWSSYLDEAKTNTPTPFCTPSFSFTEPALLSPITEIVDEETTQFSSVEEELANLKISSVPDASSYVQCVTPSLPPSLPHQHQLIDINQLYAFCYNQAYQNIIMSLTPLPVSPTITSSCCVSPLPAFSIIQNETMNEEQRCIKRQVICEKLYALIKGRFEDEKASIMTNMIFEGDDNLETIEELLYDDERFEAKMLEASQLYDQTYQPTKQPTKQAQNEDIPQPPLTPEKIDEIMSKECKKITIQIGEKTSKSIFKRVTIKVNMSKEQIFDFIRKVEDEKDQLN